MKDIQKWVTFLTDQFGEDAQPTEYKTIAGRTLSIDDGKGDVDIDIEFGDDGSFQRIVSYITTKKR